jgi:hypothetical protein
MDYAILNAESAVRVESRTGLGHHTLTTNPSGEMGTAFQAYRAKADPAFATLKGQVDHLIDTASNGMRAAGVTLDPRTIRSFKAQVVEHLEQETFLYDREVAGFGSSGELGSKSAFVVRELTGSLEELFHSGHKTGKTDFSGGVLDQGNGLVAPTLSGELTQAGNAIAATADRAANVPMVVESQFGGMVPMPQPRNHP